MSVTVTAVEIGKLEDIEATSTKKRENISIESKEIVPVSCRVIVFVLV